MSSGIVVATDSGHSISLNSRPGDGIPFDITARITREPISISIGNGDSADIRIEDGTLAPTQCWLQRDAEGDLFFVNRGGSKIEKRNQQRNWQRNRQRTNHMD